MWKCFVNMEGAPWVWGVKAGLVSSWTGSLVAVLNPCVRSSPGPRWPDMRWISYACLSVGSALLPAFDLQWPIMHLLYKAVQQNQMRKSSVTCRRLSAWSGRLTGHLPLNLRTRQPWWKWSFSCFERKAWKVPLGYEIKPEDKWKYSKGEKARA